MEETNELVDVNGGDYNNDITLEVVVKFKHEGKEIRVDHHKEVSCNSKSLLKFSENLLKTIKMVDESIEDEDVGL